MAWNWTKVIILFFLFFFLLNWIDRIWCWAFLPCLADLCRTNCAGKNKEPTAIILNKTTAPANEWPLSLSCRTVLSLLSVILFFITGFSRCTTPMVMGSSAGPNCAMSSWPSIDSVHTVNQSRCSSAVEGKRYAIRFGQLDNPAEKKFIGPGNESRAPRWAKPGKEKKNKNTQKNIQDWDGDGD